MLQDFPLFPEQASTFAGRLDAFFLFLVGVSLVFGTLIFVLILWFAIRYRRRAPGETPAPAREPLWLELTWTLVPFVLGMVMFAWGAHLYFFASRPPEAATEIFAVGKQWMWKFQHPQGAWEINQLHVPMGRPIKLTMASEDVIHSFFVPAFRIKRDVVPGTYMTAWFEATRTGEYHLFCAEYCGTQHSGMIGRVVVLAPAEYERWLRRGGAAPGAAPAAAGEALFRRLGCQVCHRAEPGALGPSLVGLLGQPVRLVDGTTVVADEAYVRESILDPRAKLVAGYPPIMPTFRGQITEEGILQILAYLRSLGAPARREGNP